MRIVIECEDVSDAIEKLRGLQDDIDNDEDYLSDAQDGETIYTDFGSVEF